MQAGEQAIEGNEAGPAHEDAVEAAFELRGALWTGLALVGLEVGVEPPDQLTGDVEGAALVIVEADQLVHRALGMNPAESMLTYSELAGVIGQDQGCPGGGHGRGCCPTRRLRWRS